MTRVPRIVLTSLVVAGGMCTTPVPAQETDTPTCGFEAVVRDSSYPSRAIAFASRLAESGPRQAASTRESIALRMVVEELESIGLDVAIEVFDYETFLFETSRIQLGDTPVSPVILGLNPFSQELVFSGEAIIVTDPSKASDEIAGRIVVTNHPLMQLMIAEFEPSVVICVEEADLESFQAKDSRTVSLEVIGRSVVARSANVVARFGPRQTDKPETLVTSHIDAYQNSPGANDNGTGLGLMIELARAFAAEPRKTEASIAFVAFGAEEQGAIGSRAYLQHHVSELGQIRAVVNLDTLGGALGPVIATKPSEDGASPDGPGIYIPTELRGRAWEGPAGNWRIIHPEIIPTAFTSYYPEWLHEIVTKSATGLGIEVVHLDLISDHRSFARAGVPSISIQSKEHQIHSEDDTADALVSETIEAGAKLAARILCELVL